MDVVLQETRNEVGLVRARAGAGGAAGLGLAFPSPETSEQLQLPGLSAGDGRGRQCRRERPWRHGAILREERRSLQRGRISFWENIGSSLGREAAVSARQEAADVEVPAGRDYEWPEAPSSHTEPSWPCPALPFPR